MKRNLAMGVAMVSAGLLAAGIAPAQALTGAKCTETHSGDSTISVTVLNGGTRVVCVGGGTDTVNITGAPAVATASTRFVIVKGNGTLNINWEAGSSLMGFDNAGNPVDGEFLIIRPATATVNATQGTNYNGDTTGATAACGTNLAYAQAANIPGFVSGKIDWYTTLGIPTVADVGC